MISQCGDETQPTEPQQPGLAPYGLIVSGPFLAVQAAFLEGLLAWRGCRELTALHHFSHILLATASHRAAQVQGSGTR